MSVRAIEAEVSIKSGVSAECTIGREVVREVHDETVLEPLTVTANGQYEPSEGVNGFSDVTVSVPERIPVTESLSVTENGTYEPTGDVDGYNSVVVSIPQAISGSFAASETNTALKLNTNHQNWTHLLIIPHTYPYAETQPRGIVSKYIDTTLNAVISGFMSSDGTRANGLSFYALGTDQIASVTNGVVSFGGAQAYAGKWIEGHQYDWWAW